MYSPSELGASGFERVTYDAGHPDPMQSARSVGLMIEAGRDLQENKTRTTLGWVSAS